MIIYNTTFHLDDDIADEGVSWLKSVFVPQAVASGFLLRPSLRQVIQTVEDEGQSVALQFHVKNMETLDYWLEREGQVLLQQLMAQFGAKVAGFSTILEEISLDE